MSMRGQPAERGAAAVEFAILVPVLLLLVIGGMELARAQFEQAGLAGAAREAARSYAITKDPASATQAGIAASTGVVLASDNFTITPTAAQGGCAPGASATVVVRYRFEPVTGLIGGIDMSTQAVFACER